MKATVVECLAVFMQRLVAWLLLNAVAYCVSYVNVIPTEISVGASCEKLPV